MLKKLRIAMIGTRGIPANYGGFETCVEEVATRLANRHDVTVYCRKSSYDTQPSEWKGVKLKYFGAIARKSMETLSNSFLLSFDLLFNRYDVIFAFNVANAPALILPVLFRKNIIMNTDGLEWKRAKWGKLASQYYLFSERLGAWLFKHLISDSIGIQKYYRRRYKVNSTYIAYGAPVVHSTKPDILKQFGLEPGKYFLQITRLEPDNNPLLTLQAFNQLNRTDFKMVLIGGNKYRFEYIENLEKEVAANPNIVYPGAIYDKEILDEIWSNCYAYIHGNEVGGTNPALLQAMGAGNVVIARKCVFNRAILEESGLYYSPNVQSLKRKMEWVLAHPEKLQTLRTTNQQKIANQFNWDKIAADYERLAYKSVNCVVPETVSDWQVVQTSTGKPGSSGPTQVSMCESIIPKR